MAMAAPLAAGAVESAAAGTVGAAAAESSGAAAAASGGARAGGAGAARGSAGRPARTPRKGAGKGSRGSAGSAVSVDPGEIVGATGQPSGGPPGGGDGGGSPENTEASGGSSGQQGPTGDGKSFAEEVNDRVRRAQPSQQVAGGLLAALIAYPVLLNFLQGGTPQVRRWFRAKFLNDTGSGAGSSGSSAGSVLNASLGGARAGTTTSGPSVVNAGFSSGGSGSSANGPPAGSLGGTSSSRTSSKAAAAIAFARAQIGRPYVWGGTGPPLFKGYDCSGLVMKAYAAAGVTLPRTTGAQVMVGRAVAQSDLQPGDLVFPDSGHVGIYTGNGMFVEAPRTGLNVREVRVWGFWKARRVV